MKQGGFTLIELLIVMAIAAILAAIALPAYNNYVLQSNRTLAINALQEAAGREASYYTTTNGYASSMTTLGYSADPVVLGANALYSMTVSTSSGTDGGFTLTATAQNNQANDTACGNFSINALGVKAVSGTSTAQTCWGY